MAEPEQKEPDAPAPSGDRGPLLTTDMAARLLMRTPQRIRDLAKEGWIVRQGKSSDPRYHLLDVVQGYIRFRDDADRRATKTASATRVSDARAREIELRNAIRERKFAETSEVIEFIDKLIGTLRSELSGLAARCTRDLVLRRTIDTAVNDILNRIADLATARADLLEAGRDDGEALQAHDAGRVGVGEQDAPADVGRSGAA